MSKPDSNPYIRKLKPVMMKYLTERFGVTKGASLWQKTLNIAQKYWDETTYIGGRENILADNLYMSEILFAAVEACNRDFPGEDILRLGDALMVTNQQGRERAEAGQQALAAAVRGAHVRRLHQKVRNQGLGQHVDHGGQPLRPHGRHCLALHLLPSG